MNWRKSNAELARLHARSPWLYMMEWRERLDRCVEQLHAGCTGLSPEAAEVEARQLRSTAEWLGQIADTMEARAHRDARIIALRRTTGRTPAEAKLYAEKADALEATLR